MADLFFTGGASSTVQVVTVTPAVVEVGDVFNIIATAEDGATTVTITFTATVATVANVAAGLLAAWNASTNALCTPITASGGVTAVVLTADTAGVPFYITTSTTDGGGNNTQTLTAVVTTANTSSEDWNTAANWSTGAKPVAADKVYLDGRAANAISLGLVQTSITLAELHIDRSMRYAVGTISAKMRVSWTKGYIGRLPSDGSTPTMTSLVNLNAGTAQHTTIIYGTRNVGTSSQPPVQLIGTHASNAVTVLGSSIVGIGTNTRGEAATVLTLTVKDSAKVEVGSGVTLTTINLEGGETVVNCAFTTLAYGTGAVRTEGSGAITTVNVGGRFIGNSTGTITTVNVYNKGFADFEQSTSARTVTSGFIYGPDAKFSVDNGVPLSVTVTNGVDCLAGAKTTQVNWGDNVNVQAAAN